MSSGPIALFFVFDFVSYLLYVRKKLHGPSMLAVKAKIYGVIYKQSSSIAFDETSGYWSALKST